MPIVDVFTIVMGFIFRLLVGGYASNTPLSKWIVLTTFAAALFLGFAKRIEEYHISHDTGGSELPVAHSGYNMSFLNALLILMSGITIVCYLMYTVSPEVMESFNTDKLYFTSIFVIEGIVRYVQVILVEASEFDPSKILLKDCFIQLAIAGWIFSFLWLLYFRG